MSFPLAFLLASGAFAQQPPRAQTIPLPIFEFHSGFWVNLHHFLYQQAHLRGTGPSVSAGAGTTPATEPVVSTSALSPAEKQAWTAAVDYYAAELAGRDLLFNGDMVLINNRLAELENCPDLTGRSAPACNSGLRPELVGALEHAAPVYRARWWPEHDRANRAWIAAVAPMVREMGTGLAQQLAAIYEEDWPAGRLRVDVVWYAGAFGAYTTLDPIHLTLSSHDPRDLGLYGFEVLFHEASHALAGGVRDAIARECRTRNKPIPRDLWHALLFYTTGEVVKRALTSSSAPASAGDYTPYANRFGLYVRGWSNFQRLLERYWQPYLDGNIPFDTAVARLVSAL